MVRLALGWHRWFKATRRAPGRWSVAAVFLLAGVAAASSRFAPWPSLAAFALALAAAACLALLRTQAERAALEARTRDAQRSLREQASRLDETQATLLGVARQLEERAVDLDETHRHLELALQGSNDGVWEYDMRTHQLYLSPGFRERLGLDPGEFQGQLAWFEEHLHLEDVERWRQAVQAHLEQHTSYNMDVRLRTPTGEYRWFRARGSAEWDLTGQPSRMSGSLTDITERRFAEARLRESEESFRSLSAASPVGILKADAFGLCDYCNKRWQEITGLSDFEALGEGWFDAIAAEDRERISELWIRTVCTGHELDEQFRVLAPDGSQRWVHSRANAVRDFSDTITGFVVTFEDITGERHAAVALADARDKAMQAAQAKSEFLANMSHEIRTPLNGIIGMTELLAGTSLGEEQRDFVRTITTSADALLAIINDILDFSKIEAGKLHIERVEFDLRTVFEDVAELLAPRARERGLELLVSVPPTLPRRLTGDPMRIRQILLNLAANAIKFTEHGEVELAAEELVHAWPTRVFKLSVRDTGIGIPENRLGAVFESFTQADGSTTRKYGGTGLGLTICRQLARLMGGSIHVSSQFGVGSQFWVELPLAPGAGADAVDASCDFAGARVLVVDDHPINRRVLVEMLRGWRAQPVEAGSGEEALAIAARAEGHAFDLVLMDFRMPGLDGLETARRMRALPGAARRAMVMLSGHNAPEAEHDEIGPGRTIEMWLTRPIREASLSRVLARVMGRAHVQAQVEALSAAAEDFSSLALLLVDDNEVNRKVALRMLQKLGASATIAVNGAEAVHRIAEQHYDLVFMDCQMPEMDGFEATRAVREREAASGGHVRIVAMTANAMEGDRERCLECGMDDYIAKPVKIDTLLAQLRRAFAGRAGEAGDDDAGRDLAA